MPFFSEKQMHNSVPTSLNFDFDFDFLLDNVVIIILLFCIFKDC